MSFPRNDDYFFHSYVRQVIGLRNKVQENPIFHGKIYGFLSIFPYPLVILWGKEPQIAIPLLSSGYLKLRVALRLFQHNGQVDPRKFCLNEVECWALGASEKVAVHGKRTQTICRQRGHFAPTCFGPINVPLAESS